MNNSNFANYSSTCMPYFLNNNINLNIDKDKNNINMINNNNGNNNNCPSFINNGNEQNNSSFSQINKNEESIDILVNQMESSFSISTNIIKNVSNLLESSKVEDKIKGIRLVYASLHYKYKNNNDYKKNLLNRGCNMLNTQDKNANEQNDSENNNNNNNNNDLNNNNSNNNTMSNPFFQNNYNNNDNMNNGINTNNNNNPNNCNSNDGLNNYVNNTPINFKVLNSMIFTNCKSINDVDEYFHLLDKCLTRENVIDINLSDIFEMNIINIIKSLLYNYIFHNDEIIVEALTLLIIIFGCCDQNEKIKQDVVDELYTCTVYMLKNICHKSCEKLYASLIVQLIICLLRTIMIYDISKLKNDLLDNIGIVEMLLKSVENIPNLNGVRVCYTLVVYGLKMFYASACQLYEKSFLRELETITNYLSICIKMSDERILFLTSSICITICENQVGIDVLLKTDILHNAVILCESSNPDLAFEALSIISKIAYAANHQQICILISCNVIKALKKILNNTKIKPGARARACNALGNIGCETTSEVELLIKNDVFPLLVEIFQTDNDFNTKIEAAYAVCACLSKANQKQVGYIISCTATTNRFGQNICMQLIADMLELVSESDPMNNGSVKLCKSILRGLENILDKGDDETRDLSLWENPYVFMFKEVQGDIKLLQMQFFPEYYVVNKTYDILAKYFSLTSTWNNRK
ncbi:hypothetical protein YYC_00744 [Plasmodium yoelii 17X]|uniref:ARM repeat-containing protein n=3 Tax=Plasmodium yoelii TaxID=5861 RepID=A0AAE9X113_PLAYO|nr:conserved Plasmodium protein, unknown function [Plasmodium yoelii]ETB63163.1 hypothetical protein YYC_00744 [Plasmodium yoelii 17X]WBY59918.1 hypothetical protein Py17XNL_001303103 [Plasmodium yoelii yoelii]CDU19862.1 conserved Plasmodium protein, unknown function [Plasmodium yoelii]VTZ80619.1 conserved Plasmodium protein, unknown function [Plasmodium yoelii]|eukprot:XP_730252.2 conserved Plasmodium protein, unknown function [Plasmodium yoelii]